MNVTKIAIAAGAGFAAIYAADWATKQTWFTSASPSVQTLYKAAAAGAGILAVGMLLKGTGHGHVA